MDISRLAAMPDLDRETVISLRRTYMSPTLQGFCMSPDDPVVISRGEGPYLYDTDGKKYLDCTGQNMCISIGAGHPVTKELIRKQLDRVQHVTTLLFNEMSAQYAKELVDHLPAGQDWVVQFVNSGAEALDLAFMMSRAYSCTCVMPITGSTGSPWAPAALPSAVSPHRPRPVSTASSVPISTVPFSARARISMWKRSAKPSGRTPADASPVW